MNIGYSKKSVLSSFFWKFLERSGTHIIQFIIQIILARLLLPKDFGTVIIVLVFVNLGQILVQGGLNTALIQKKNIDEKDYSTIFYFTLIVSSIAYCMIYFLAPLISDFFNDENLILVLRVLSLTIFLNVFLSIQHAYIAKNMIFKVLLKSSLISILVSGTLGIIAAYNGFGVWAIVLQQIFNQFLNVVILNYLIDWHPKLIFSIDRLKELYSFGWKILLSALLNNLYNNLRTLIIARMFSPTILSYYNRGEQFPLLVINNLNGSLQSILLPTLSSLQDDKRSLKEILRKSIKLSSFIIFPILIGLAASSEQIIILLLTEAWTPTISFMIIFCFAHLFTHIQTSHIQAINAVGKSSITLKIEVIRTIISIIILICCIPLGIYFIAIGMILINFLSLIIISITSKVLFEYSYYEQLRDFSLEMFLSIIMGGIVFLIPYLKFPLIWTFILQIFVGISIYLLLAILCKNSNIIFLKNLIMPYIKRKI